MQVAGSFRNKNRFVRSLSIFLALFLALSVTPLSAQQHADANLSQSGIYAVAATQATYMLLRVTDPSGEIIYEQSSDGNPIAWNVPAGTPDGFYSYEIRIGNAPKKGKREDVQGRGPKIRAMVESGTILIENGIAVPQVESETSMLETIRCLGSYALHTVLDFIVTPAAADQVILDDLIVDGSECVGMDCVNGESFGFDTIRLKENNLRIKFDDTSTSASFPKNDWQIIINDSANGGGSYFAVEDTTAGKIPFRIEAGAPANSLYVEDYGRVGIGTATPVVEVHIQDSDTPTVRLDQDGSGGWSPQVWDVAGNESNFFIRDATNGSYLPFRIQPGAPTSTLTLRSGGKVGVNTWAPTHELHVVGNALITGNLELGSSREIKNNIESLTTDEAMMTVAMLRPVKFQYKASPGEDTIGFIAEEVPDLVATQSRKSISTMDVVAVLTKVVQDQQKAIDELYKTIAQLQTKIESNSVQQPVPAAQ